MVNNKILIIDASVLIEMNNHTHRQEVFSPTWEKINENIRNGTIILLPKVYDELAHEIKSVLTKSNIHFTSYANEYSRVISEYETKQTVVEMGADAHILAYALSLKNNNKNPLIVTAEGLQNNPKYPIKNVTIPTMAEFFQINCLHNRNWGLFLLDILQHRPVA